MDGCSEEVVVAAATMQQRRPGLKIFVLPGARFEISGSNGPIYIKLNTHAVLILPRMAKYEVICSNRTEDMSR